MTALLFTTVKQYGEESSNVREFSTPEEAKQVWQAWLRNQEAQKSLPTPAHILVERDSVDRKMHDATTTTEEYPLLWRRYVELTSPIEYHYYLIDRSG
jgi:hypothetical protein